MQIDQVQWQSGDRGSIIINSDTVVPWPCDTWHKDAVEAWLAAGNEIAPPPAESTEHVLSRLTAAVQRHLDTTAKGRNYDNMMSLCTYATSLNAKFNAEGQAGVEWRDAVWATCYQVMDDVLAGIRPVPTEAELIAELPVFAWPV